MLYDHTGILGLCDSSYNFYYAKKDAQGNISALLDGNGAVVVKYVYTAYGECKVLNANGAEITDMTHIGNVNPFRYRSYYYDVNTGLYYLKSRFYDPETGRFLNADAIRYLKPNNVNGLNLYAYCRNNPIMFCDPNGNSWKKIWTGIKSFFSNTLNAFLTSIEFEIGIGCGIGVNLSDNITAEFSRDTYVGIDDGVGASLRQ